MALWHRLLVAAALASFACSSSGSPPATAPAIASPPADAPVCAPPAPGEVMTQPQCECLGGRVNASIGGGRQAHCADGEDELGRVRFGIEGGWCCRRQLEHRDAYERPPARLDPPP
jgi:hypothetical protein